MVEMGARMLKEVVLSASGAQDSDRILANELYRSIVDLGLRIYGDRIIESK
jgi:hypothetical protein